MSKTYTATMNVLGDLHRKGIIDDNAKAQAIEYGRLFKKAHDEAITVAEKDGPVDLVKVTAALGNLTDFIRPYAVKGGK